MILIKPSYKILTEIDRPAMLRRIEAAGRTCYKSENKITNDSAHAFVKKIILSGHLSVIEHIDLSVRFVVDRGVSHELVRHRLASFSQESTRYCNYKGGVTFIIPPWVNIEPGAYCDIPGHEFASNCLMDNQWYWMMSTAEQTYLALLKLGWTPQQARSVLPNSLKTEIVMTANLREWRHIFKLRCANAAHPQMREIMCPLLDVLKEELPEVFGDINYK
jgi:thymidylate synthase (FAD)